MEEIVRMVDGSGVGYLVLAGVGFAEYAGAPIVSVPVLVAAGALSTTTSLDPVLVVASAATGGLAADLIWFGLGRWQGRRLVSVACSISSSPVECVVDVERKVRDLGLRLVIPSKFLPGVGNLLAPAAGFAGLGSARFAAGDLAALVLWATGYTGLGVLFADQVRPLLAWIAAYRSWAVFLAGVGVGGAVVWRWVRARRHARGHERGDPSPAADGGPASDRGPAEEGGAGAPAGPAAPEG